MKRLKWWLRGLGQKAFPRLTLAVLANRTWLLEPEVALIPLLSKRKGLAIDAGANKGVYFYHLARTYRRVCGFEPLPVLASYLSRAKPANADVFSFALSNTAATATLRLPRGYNELGSLEDQTRTQWDTTVPIETHTIDTVTLDSFAFADVSLIKIDVEGHELAVLEGASRTLDRWRPTIVIEVEERHRPRAVASVCARLEATGYKGYFLDGVSLKPIADFDSRRDQNPASLAQSVKVARYINNFIFFDGDEAADLVAGIEAALDRTTVLDLGAALDTGATAKPWQKLSDWTRAIRHVLVQAGPHPR
jgi:FkbM family methyltransferase